MLVRSRCRARDPSLRGRQRRHAVRCRHRRSRAARLDGRRRHGVRRRSLRRRDDGRAPVDARKPPRALHRHLLASRRRDRRRADVDPRLAARERAARARPGDRCRRVAVGRRRHALPPPAAERHDDAPAADGVPDRDPLDVAHACRTTRAITPSPSPRSARSSSSSSTAPGSRAISAPERATRRRSSTSTGRRSRSAPG